MARKRQHPSSAHPCRGLAASGRSVSSHMASVTERHVTIARQLVLSGEEVLNLSRINRPENTSKAIIQSRKNG
ncbi:uncharacterized protein BDW43DRAFT_291637 [Aspergillus alliaceus]|uniref:uncharacterized protein n=1 Tax=Petromyces alliaceus TaxID=209559 RepID=UPI0012A6FC99|nr:uncharacterized protein BDW43DRAFT_291637 [Aspergillus alliaceus]KAB8228293.1 hypothetical protein BDW43DRAFT_291637 [Aspergillus alliaceus]